MRIELRGAARVRLADASLEGFELRGTFAHDAAGHAGRFEVTRSVEAR